MRRKRSVAAADRTELLADYLPFCESVRVPYPQPPTPRCCDPFDAPFLELVLVGSAEALATGDRDLHALALGFAYPTVCVDDFLERLGCGGTG